ncbi:MAG: polyprenyl synthetase family protein [Endozoicomonadaceae bacterium]|nr:polyprenyl synthetase family protein [Endozoicomonadaceae bacterium]
MDKMLFEDYKKTCIQWVNAGIAQILDNQAIQQTDLLASIRYTALGAGKRIRAIFVHAACSLNQGDPNKALPAACAVELLHAYSLIHDDLPSMDNDDWRRGKPSCHKAFGEALAILTGDALQALSMQVLINSSQPHDVKLYQLKTLIEASGCQGMVAGQVMDIMQHQASAKNELQYLEKQNHAKTGALICAALSLGAYASNANQLIQKQLEQYGRAIGLAFQIQDDILDVAEKTDNMDKSHHSDYRQNKLTYVSVLGLSGARKKLSETFQKAEDTLSIFGPNARMIRQLTRYILERKY